MTTQRARTIYSISLVFLDILMVIVAFVLAYELRANIPWPAELVSETPLSSYFGLMLAMVLGVVVMRRPSMTRIRGRYLVKSK